MAGEPGTDLAVSQAPAEPFRVETGPLEVAHGPAPDDTDGDEVPDFVMVGLPGANGMVRLFASRTLTRAQLQRRVAGIMLIPVTPNPNGPKACVPDVRLAVVAEMKDFTQVVGDTYRDALRSLMELWDRG